MSNFTPPAVRRGLAEREPEAESVEKPKAKKKIKKGKKK